MGTNYARAKNKQKIKVQLLGRIASDIAFLADHYEDDPKISELVDLMLPWFEERKILEVDRSPKCNVIDFADYVRRKEVFDDPE